MCVLLSYSDRFIFTIEVSDLSIRYFEYFEFPESAKLSGFKYYLSGLLWWTPSKGNMDLDGNMVKMVKYKRSIYTNHYFWIPNSKQSYKNNFSLQISISGHGQVRLNYTVN